MAIPKEYQEKLSQVYIGLDLHKYTHTAVTMDCFSTVIDTYEFENKPSEFIKLVDRIKSKADARTLIFGLEDVGGNGRSLAVFLCQMGFITKEVNAALAAGYRKGDAQYKKNDAHDAKCVAEVLLHKLDRLPDANPQDLHWTLSQLVNRRNLLIKDQTKATNQLQEQLKHHYPSYNKFFSKVRGQTALFFWETYPSPMHLKDFSVEDLAVVLREASGNRLSTKKATAIMDIIRTDGNTTTEYQEERDEIVRSLVRQLLYLKREIEAVESIMEKTEAKLGYRLKSMPGVNTVTSCDLIAEIGDIHRFKNPDKLAKFAGISPVNFSSAGKGKDKISKQGNRKLHGIFYFLAVQQVQVARGSKIPRNQAFYNYYQKKMKEGKSKGQALVCVMRRLVNIIFGMMRNKTEYRMPIVEVPNTASEVTKEKVA